MQGLTQSTFLSMSDNYVSPNELSDTTARDSIPLLPHNTNETDEQNSGQSPQVGYIPIRLDMKLEDSLQDCSLTPVSDAIFSDKSWVDEAWKLDDEPLSKPDGTLELDFLKIEYCSQRIPEDFSLPENQNGFDEAFESFCNSSPLDYDLSSSSCESSGNAQNARDITQRSAPRSINQGPPDMIITEALEDAHRPQTLLDTMHGNVIEQSGLSAKPFLENPIQTHYTQAGKTEYLVRLSHNEVQLRMPEWLKLYEEQRTLLEELSGLSGSRARLPKRKRETGGSGSL